MSETSGGPQLHTSLTELNPQTHRDRHVCYKILHNGSWETDRQIIFSVFDRQYRNTYLGHAKQCHGYMPPPPTPPTHTTPYLPRMSHAFPSTGHLPVVPVNLACSCVHTDVQSDTERMASLQTLTLMVNSCYVMHTYMLLRVHMVVSPVSKISPRSFRNCNLTIKRHVMAQLLFRIDCLTYLLTYLTYLLTYLLTPSCRVLLEKLTGLQLVKKFPAFHGTRRFITVLTSVRHLSLSWANPIQSIYPHPTTWRSILILSTHLYLGLPSGLFPSGFPSKTLYTPSPHPHTPHAHPISFFSILPPA